MSEETAAYVPFITIIFSVLVLMIFIVVLVSFLTMKYIEHMAHGQVQAIEFANLVKYKLENNLGDGHGNIYYTELVKNNGKSVEEVVGLRGKKIIVTDLKTDKNFHFSGDGGYFKHSVYSTIYSHYLPVTQPSEVVMQTGKEYFVHIYNITDDGVYVVFDIYQKPVCSDEGTMLDSTGIYQIIGCSSFPVDVTAFDLDMLRGKIVNVSANRGEFIAKLVPDKDVKAEELLSFPFKFRDPDPTEGSYIMTILGLLKQKIGLERLVAFRVMGEYVTPAKIYVEIDNDDTMVDTNSPYAVIGGPSATRTSPTRLSYSQAGVFDYETRLPLYKSGETVSVPYSGSTGDFIRKVISADGKKYAIETLGIDPASIRTYTTAEMEAMVRVEICRFWSQLEDKHGSTLADARKAVLSYGYHETGLAHFKAGPVPNHDGNTLGVYSITPDKGTYKNQFYAFAWDVKYNIWLGVDEIFRAFRYSAKGEGTERWKNAIGYVFLPRNPGCYWTSSGSPCRSEASNEAWEKYKDEEEVC